MAHHKCMKALYCHKDYQCEKGYVSRVIAIQVLIPKGKSMNARFYKKKVLRKHTNFYQNRQSKNSICGIYLSHEKVLSHKAGSMTSFLNEQGDYFLEHITLFSLYSLLWLFFSFRFKKNLAGRKYISRQKLGAATFDLFRCVSKKDFEKKKTLRKPSRIRLKDWNFVYLWKESTLEVWIF